MHSLQHLLLLALLLQSEKLQNIRLFFGHNVREIVQLLKESDEAYFRKQRLNSTQIAARTALDKVQEKLASDTNVLAVDGKNLGAGLVAMLSNSRLTATQINIVFCPQNERVMAVQLLVSRIGAASNTSLSSILQDMYELPQSERFDTHRPLIKYPLPGVSYSDDGRWQAAVNAQPVSVWNLGNTEILFQPVTSSPTVNGQLWFADKTVANDCAAGPGGK